MKITQKPYVLHFRHLGGLWEARLKTTVIALKTKLQNKKFSTYK